MNFTIDGTVRNGLPSLRDQMFDTGEGSVLDGYQPRNVTTWTKPNRRRNRKVSRLPFTVRSSFSIALFFVGVALLGIFIGIQIGRTAVPAPVTLQETKP